MPKWIHRTTKYILVSVSEAELPEVVTNYILEPDFSAVAGEPTKYWKIVGDNIELMTQGEQDAVDAALLSDSRDSKVAQEIDNTEQTLRQVITVIMDEINILRAQHSLPARTLAQLKNAIRNGYGG
jgi:hypothetical protein